MKRSKRELQLREKGQMSSKKNSITERGGGKMSRSVIISIISIIISSGLIAFQIYQIIKARKKRKQILKQFSEEE